MLLCLKLQQLTTHTLLLLPPLPPGDAQRTPTANPSLTPSNKTKSTGGKKRRNSKPSNKGHHHPSQSTTTATASNKKKKTKSSSTTNTMQLLQAARDASREKDCRLPVTLLSGFLGSGKVCLRVLLLRGCQPLA